MIKTGQTASATLAIRNSSDHTIAFSDGPPGHGCAIDVEAALQGSNVTITPNFPEDCELPPPMLTTGITKVPLSIATAYNSCTMTDQPTQNMPRCDGNGVTPALPAGDYTVSLMTSTGDPFAQVEPDPLKLTD